MGNNADDGITPEHTHKLYSSIKHDNKELVWIEGANHYFFGQRELADEAAQKCAAWMQQKGFN